MVRVHMQFGKDHKVKIETLSKEEAQDFVIFLSFERQRHLIAIQQANHFINDCRRSKSCSALIKFFQSAITRHKEDISETENLIERVRKPIE